MQTLSCSVVTQTFPAGTPDPGFTFTVTGTLADGTTPFEQTVLGTDPTASFDLPAGTFTGTVSKLGVVSQPSAPLTVTAATTVTLSVPDATQPATLA